MPIKHTNKRNFLLSICLLVPSFTTASFDFLNDQEVVAYCKQPVNQYIAIIWPKGYHALDYIIETLSLKAHIDYIKTFQLNAHGVFILYYNAHTMHYPSAKKFFKPYLWSTIDPQQCMPMAAIVFQTEASVADIISWKKKIRKHIGADYASIHIDDSSAASCRIAPIIFDEAVLLSLNDLPEHTKLI